MDIQEEKKFIGDQLKTMQKQKDRAIRRAEDLEKKMKIFAKYLKSLEAD